MSDISREQLNKMYIEENKTIKQISIILNTSKNRVNYLIKKYELYRVRLEQNPLNHNKEWTTEQEEFLINKFGKMSIKAIANSKIIQRKPSSVRKKARMLKLGDTRAYDDYVTKNYLSNALNVDHKTIERWIEKEGLKIYKRVVANKQQNINIKISEFWEWAENHKKLIKWNKFIDGVLGVEPSWTKEIREEYKKNNPPKLGEEWTNEEESLLNSYFKIGIPIKKIAENLGRSEDATCRRLSVIMADRKKYISWGEKDIKKLKKFVRQGMKTKEIAVKMNRPVRNVMSARERYINKSKKQIKANL